jgi:serine phosphatase RsbU (regulator of sigma subunit)/putative methionine-R-sulfoxide reductase with GAF domain/anti-sigma regulatory factor (Ser/Thr protein kinase)
VTSVDDPLPVRAAPRHDRDLAELQRFTDAALAHLAIEDLLAELLNRITEILHTDTAAILLASGNELHARAAKGIEEEVEQGVRIPVGSGFAGRIAAERRAIFIPDVDHADIFNPILRQKGIKSLLGVPLLVEGRVLGVLHVGTLTPREFTDADADLLQVAADRAALAIDHAILYEAERTARLDADQALGVMRAVQRVTDAALASLSLDELLTALLERISEILGSDTAAILLLDDEGQVLRARAAKGIEEEVEQGVRIPVGRGFAGRIAAERRPVVVADVDHADILNPILREKGIKSLLGVPLLVEGEVLGVLHVGCLTPREFTDADADLLQVAADRAALAIDHALALEQRQLTETLQRSLLPQELIVVPGIDAAARYLPAASGSALGGDWYDVFPLGDGRIAMVVGDVVGRGVEAAALMAQLRTALRAYAFDGHGPAEVVDRVNGLLMFLRPGTMTTAAYLILDPEAERLTVVCAGHPPPMVIDPDGTARFLDPPTGIALGVTRGSRYAEWECDLPAGTTTVLFTDGVVEVRGESLEVGMERMRVLAERGFASLAALCDAAVDELIADGRPADDVALLAVRATPLSDRLETSWPADAESLAGLRHLLRRWLRHHGADADATYDITVACQEAAANAVEHAYAPGTRTFECDAAMEGRTVVVTVRDHGQWRSARGTHRGRGLPMMEALMDRVDVEQHDHGTVVVLRRALP